MRQTTTSLSQARYAPAAAFIGDIAFFAGGASNASGGYSTVVDIYNVLSNSWTTAALSEARSLLAATSAGGLVLFAGGYYGTSSLSSVVDIYDVSLNGWTTATLSEARYALAATSVGDLAFFAGGENVTFPISLFSSVVNIYNASSGSWTTASLSQARRDLAATSAGHLAFFAGGFNGTSGGTSRVDIYNASSNSWTMASLSEARSSLAATSVGGLALFAGGFTSSSLSSVVDIYNVSSDSWTTASLSQARYSLAATSVGDLVFFAGGYDGSYYHSSVVDIYNASSNSWTSASLSEPRHNLAAASVGCLAFFAGGYAVTGGPGVSSVVDIFNISVTSSAAPIPLAAVAAEFDLAVPAVTISSRSPGATQQAIDLNLLSLEEVGDTAVLQTIDLQTAGWTAEQNNGSAAGGGVKTDFVSRLGAATGGANNATIRYLFNTFNSDDLITTGSNYSFKVTPALLKFSIDIVSWKWISISSKLRLAIKIDPPFVSFTRWDDAPQAGMTTLLLSSAKAEQASSVVRLLNFGEVLAGTPARVAVEASVSTNSSSLFLTFNHFVGTLSYDPDVGLLLGSTPQGASTDNLGLIIGVSVAIPVAFAFVVLSISVISVVTVLKRRAARAKSRGAVAFDVGADSDNRL